MKIYAQKTIYSNNYCSVINYGIEFNNGQNGSGVYLHNKLGGVVVIARKLDRYVLVVHERVIVGGKRLEFVRGFKHQEESPEDAAIREFKEEVGGTVKRTVVLGKIEPDSGLIKADIDVVLLEVAEDSPLVPCVDEGILGIELLTMEEIMEAIRQNKIVDSYTLSAVGMLISHGM